MSIDKENINEEDIVREYVFDWDENPAKNFFIMESDLRRIAMERKVPLKLIIQEFITDLENRNNPEYESKVQEMPIIPIQGYVSQGVISEAKKYFAKVIRSLDKAAKNEAKKEKNKEKEQKTEAVWELILEFIEANRELTLEETLEKIKEKDAFLELNSKQKSIIIKRTEKLAQEQEKKEALRKSKIQGTWKEICAIVDRECPQGELTERAHLKSTIEYLKAKEGKIVSHLEGEKTKLRIKDEIRDDILGLIAEQIRTSKETLYYKEVEHFTKGFSFLATDLEFQEAVSGKSGRKFIDLESYNRFYDLRAKLQKVGGEYNQICKLLKKDNIDETSKKILTERKMVMEAEKAKKAAEFVGDSAR